MIKFFRKIRQKMLTENKFSKYLLYAIGEIILVVIGILIALGVNKWNQENEKKEYEITILNEISNSLNQEINQIESQYSYLDYLQKTVVKLASYKNSNNYSQDSLVYNFNEVLKSGIATNFNYGPYETLKSSGLNKISNDKIRKSIAELYEKELKAVEFWINDYVKRKLYEREDLANELFEIKINLDTDKGIKSEYIINNQIITTNPDFNKFLALSSEFIPIAKRNLDYAVKVMNRTRDLIGNELSRLE